MRHPPVQTVSETLTPSKHQTAPLYQSDLAEETRETPRNFRGISAAHTLRVVRIDFQRGEKQRSAARLLTAALRLNGDENTVNLRQGLGIFKLQYPSRLGSVVLIEDSQIQRLLFVRSASAPCLERTCVPRPGLLVKIIGVENQGFPSGIEDTAVGFLDRKSTRLNSSHVEISYAVFCLKKKKKGKR